MRTTPRLSLAETICELRAQLDLAVAEGDGKGLRFTLGPVELEFQVEVTWAGGADAGVRFWVVSAGAKGSRSSASTHTVKLSLTPIGPGGGDVLISSSVPQLPK